MAVVLTPIDGSDRALGAAPWAAKLAGPNGTVILIRVVPARRTPAASLLALAGAEDGEQRIADAWTDEASADLDEAARAFAGFDVIVERVVAAGEPDEEIVAAAAQRGVDLIAMASHGRGAIGRAIFGSVADRVTGASPVPVLIVRAPDADPAESVVINRLVVPLDGSDMAARSLPVAVDLARNLATPVHVVRAVDPVTVAPVARGVFGAAPTVSAEITDQIWQEAEAEAQATVGGAVARLQNEGIEASGALLNGSPFFAISEATEPGDLLILTSHGHGGVRRWLLGSVAEKLVREAPVPVLLVPTPDKGDRVIG